MEVAPSAPAVMARSPESIRRRQRDRLSPRRGFANSSRIVAAREMGDSPEKKPALAPSPRFKGGMMGRADSARRRPLQDGLRRENSSKQRPNEGDSKYEPPADGSAAGREGRPFTVANVGNNGRIYLRPTVRPANQRYAQASAAFPMTPPSTAGLDVLVSLNEEGETPSGSVWTPAPSPSNQAEQKSGDYFLRTPPPLPPHSRHQRAHSCSTVDEHAFAQDSEAGVFKVVIERPATGTKAEEPPGAVPTLEVPIPSYRLGTPRFSLRGTPFFRGSSYSSADEMRSSILSRRDASYRDASAHAHSRIHSRRHSDASTQPHYPLMQSSSYSASLPSVIRHRTAIVPEIYDNLTFKPACDHPSVVRYALDGSIRAATPLRLVAEITSPTFVDYHLLSDFFLTFRAYLDPLDLLYMLIARLRWAFSREDGPGMVVRVRTFVAIRHWILNYFPDDFVMAFELRESFCDLLNRFAGELSADPSRSKVSLKILGELKKCWRRVCALFWDAPEFDPDINPDEPIHPGGLSGSRNPNVDSELREVPVDAPQLDGIIESQVVVPTATEQIGIALSEPPNPRHTHPVLSQAAQAAPGTQTERSDLRPMSPESTMSEDVVSCSLPPRARLVGTAYPIAAHPVPAQAIFDLSQPVATTPKALTGKRVRPNHSHKRSGSFSDSSRDSPSHQNGLHSSSDAPPKMPYAGSLVRGNLFPPGQATVDIIAPGTPAHSSGPSSALLGVENSRGPSAMSGPGMKKLLGSVRRALSTKTGPPPNNSPTQGSFPNIPPLGVRGATVNRLPGTAIVPQARPRNKAPMRIDILGAEVAEDFKRAVQEVAEADEQHENYRNSAQSGHTLQQDSTLRPGTFLNPRGALSALTSGSKSIVIVDDTMAPQLTDQSVDTFTDPFMQRSGGPTPPTTPPEVQTGTPRRSSHLLGEHARNDSVNEPMPPLVPESRPSKEDERTPSRRPIRRPSLRSRALSASQRSVSLRRYASFQSGVNRHKSERSFDATTISESEGGERQQSATLPRRMLRRRPGGDLRAVANVGDLNPRGLRRPMSTGSLATFTDSVRSSYMQSVDDGEYDQPDLNAQTFSVGALAGGSPKHLSLFSTHSSQPVMRPSFEKEAQMLAQIPDDTDDDGGVESALLKLEGKFERRSGASKEGVSLDVAGAHNSFGPNQNDAKPSHEEDEKRKHRQENILQTLARNSLPIQSNRPEEELQPAVYQPDEEVFEMPVSRPARLVESYNSIPLLDRGIFDDSALRRTRDWSEHSILRGPSPAQDIQHDQPTPASSHPSSFNFIYETESVKEARTHQKKHANLESRDNSFLESDSDARSSISSEMSLEHVSRTEYTTRDSTSSQTFPPIVPGTVMKEMSLPSRPLGQPTSPHITLQQPLHLPAETANLPQIHEEQPVGQKPLQKGLMLDFNTDRIASPSTNPLRAHLLPEASRKTSAHLPFTLAFDSQVLAQQFTLIEKDALVDVDWKDLIEMRWKDASADSRSWVEFLRTSEPRGVEVVMARFNLMVKWAISECVLTEDLRERVQCISKFIHIANHCRKNRNFATLTQLTIALTSNEIGRLTRTWAYVPPADIQTLRELEVLIAPTGNFNALRAEMEGCSGDQGCIPFLGIYTHDLLVNLDRPCQIASTPTTEPLVNFERYRADAMIVKNLLRLLEASQLYKFLPIEGITERCLWMAALSDGEIAKYGRMIQA